MALSFLEKLFGKKPKAVKQEVKPQPQPQPQPVKANETKENGEEFDSFAYKPNFDGSCTVTGIEVDENAHNTALHNIRANDLTSRLSSICADLRSVHTFLTPGSFDCCVSNPPYFAAGPVRKTHPVARHETLCTLEDLFDAAAWAVRFGGDFFLVHKPERLSQLCACATNHKLEPKRLLLLRHREGDPISLVLLQCRKGAKPGLTIEEECLQTAGGEPSDYYRRLYHI
jgi:tRNA1(Val) A37 N6-methylase TrmN6